MWRGQSKWGELHWPEHHKCGTVKALGCFVFSVAWGGSLYVAARPRLEVHADFHLLLRKEYCCVWISLWETWSFLLIKFKWKKKNFSEVKHYFKRMHCLTEEMILRTVEFTCRIWLLRGMKSISGELLCHTPQNDICGTSLDLACLMVLFELWGALLFTKDGEGQIMVMGMNIYFP